MRSICHSSRVPGVMSFLVLSAAAGPCVGGVPGDLLISELADGTLPGGLPKWVELTNCGPTSLDLAEYSLGNFNNGAPTMGFNALVLSGTVDAGGSYVISFENGDRPGNSVFYDVYGFDADNMDPGASINGDDAMVLFYGPVVSADMGDGSGNPVVDVYGVVGVDGTGEVWEYTDGYSRRNPDSTATAVFDPAQWFFGGANSLEAANDDEELLLIQTLTFPGEHDCGGGLALDIKPGGCPNPVNRGSQGYLPVALAGSSSVDISEVNPDSILLSRADGIGGAAAPHEGPTGPHTTYGDVATPFDGDDCDCLEDEGDGLTDLMMHFDTPGFVDALELDDFEGGEFVEIQVDGTLFDGTEFSATDCIRLVPPTGGGLLGGPGFVSDGVVNNDEMVSIVVSWNQGDAGSGPGLGGLVRVIERWGLRR
jgi:hypothetical protein